jgi:tRNA (guanine37-N1)-methyltransferase
VRFDVLTLFPDFVRDTVKVGVVGRAMDRGLLEVHGWNPRDFTEDVHRTVDDRPCGGGPGMVMLGEPLRRCLAAARAADTRDGPVLYLSPQGTRLTQRKATQLASLDRVILLCGRYEGVDERFLAAEVDEEVSIGDYVLSGGELAAAVLIDSIGRLQDGALGDAASAQEDSFSAGLLDCPHYTRPVRDGGQDVPEVLLSGNHALIRRWRLKQSLGRTWLRRPDLLARCDLDKAARMLLEEFRQEYFAEHGPDRSGRPGSRN